MQRARNTAASQVQRYVAAQAPPARRHLKTMRQLIRAVVPRAVEHFSYGIPGFRLDDRPLVWYAAFKQHCSLYPMTSAIRTRLAGALEGYEMSKGTVRFPLDQPLPSALVKKLVKARAAESRKAKA